MIKQLRYLCTLLLMVVASAAWGGEVTFTPGTDTGDTSVTKDGVTVTLTTMNNANYYQIYANQSGTFSISEGSITKIEFTCTASGTAKYGPGNASANVGSYSYSEKTGTWTGSASSVTISSTAQIRMSSLTITYATSGDTPTPTTYTVTYNANGGTGTMTDSNSPYEANAEVTLLENTFTAPSDMIWDSWEVKDADDNDIIVTDGKFTMPASNVTVKAQWVADPNAPQYKWVLTDFADLTSSDIFVIVGNNGSTYAMRNDGGANAPAVSEVTIANNMISGTVADNIKWNVSGNATNGYTFNPNGATTTLYCLDSNNGLRIGTGSGTYSDVFFMDASGYLKATIGNVTRYVGIYSSQDWRCYTSPNANNIKDQTFAFYKRVDANAPQDPSFTISDNDELDHDATSGSFNFEVNNPVNDGTTTVTENVEWISDVTISGNSVTFTTTANEATTSRSGVITLTYTFGDNETVTKDVTITQAALPASYTTIPAIFEAATSTETEVKVTFNNWVVSGVSTNGKNVFVTDNNGNGFVIYSNTDQSSTYAAGDILSGTAVSCNLKLYNGFAELLNVNASDLTITSGGTVTAANIAMADLAGVNTGALVSYENLTCSVENNKYYLSDGTTTLQVYNSLFAFEALEDGKTYNITGVYQQFNNTKEILPRSADDIVLVEDGREDPELAFIPAEFTVTLGEQITNAPTFDNPNEVDVTFSSSDAEIASWDAENGLVIGGEKTGKATITATFTGNDLYKPGTATLVVTVKRDLGFVEVVEGIGVYEKITSSDKLEAGRRYLIVYEVNDDDNTAEILNDVDNTKSYGLFATGSITNNRIDNTAVQAKPVVLQEAGDGNWFLMIDDDFLYVNTDGNYLNKSDDYTTNGTAWNIDFDADHLIRNTYLAERFLMMNKVANPHRFSCYKGTQQDVVLYKELPKVGDVNGDGSVTIADVTALVNIILGKDDTKPYKYDHEAANVNGDEGITIADVTALVNIILEKKN